VEKHKKSQEAALLQETLILNKPGYGYGTQPTDKK